MQFIILIKIKARKLMEQKQFEQSEMTHLAPNQTTKAQTKTPHPMIPVEWLHTKHESAKVYNKDLDELTLNGYK